MKGREASFSRCPDNNQYNSVWIFFFETIPQERARIDYGVCDKNERNDYEGLETSTFIMF